MSDTPRHSVSVAGIVINDEGRVLAIRRRDNDHWEAPGGVLELNESFEDGVCREILEETGVTVKAERLTGVYKNMSRGVVALVFRCRPLRGQARPTDEACEVRWITRDEATALMSPAFSVRVFDAFEESTALRIHDGVNLLTAQ
jgi:ADP-ribose pyrophosphatase YjhB (NUDIX family)